MAIDYRWKDLSMPPDTEPVVENLSAINGSLVNLASIQARELIFQPEVGLDLERLLFEPVDQISRALIIQEFRKTTLFEPRVNVTNETDVQLAPNEKAVDVFLAIEVFGVPASERRKITKLRFFQETDEDDL